MKSLPGFIFVLLFLACADAADTRYLALGDSFTIGTGSRPDASFPSRLAELALERGAVVSLKNVAVNGYSTQELIERQLPVVRGFAPTHVTLAIGANDLARGRGPTDYRRNLWIIFAALERDGVDPKNVWALPQPDWSKSPSARAFGQPAQLHAQIVLYNTILSEEVRAFGGKYFDLFPLMEEQAAQQLVASDGLHPSAAAYAAWADRLDPELGLK